MLFVCDSEVFNLDDIRDENWGGSREGAGRVSVIERKNYYFRLSEAEYAIDQQVFSAWKQVETELNRELAKELKCKQYQVAEDVYNQVLSAREKIMSAAVAAVMAEKDKIKDTLLKEHSEKQF